MKEFDISYDEVEKIAEQLRTKSSKLKSILDDISTKINEVHTQAWNSAAAENHLREYNSLKAKYANFYEKVTNCADFLDKAVAAGRELEIGINKTSN